MTFVEIAHVYICILFLLHRTLPHCSDSYNRYRKYSCSIARRSLTPTHPIMPLTKPTKLNPTTITIPQSSSTCSLYPLKLALTPHLLTEDTLNLPPIIKKEGDAIFEAMIPVGGSIEVEIEIDRDGLEKVGGADMSISTEIELEEVIKEKIVSAFRRVSTTLLALQMLMR